MKKGNDGQVSLAAESDEDIYKALKALCTRGIELGTEAEVADVLAKMREAAENGELDTLIEQQAQFGRRVTQKNK